MGEIGSQTIAPFAGESLGSLHWVVLQDDWWSATGPEASDPARDPVRSQRNESRT